MTSDGWRDLATAALVGTGRRPVPDAPDWLGERTDASPEVRLLDAVAVGGAMRRAGRRPLREPTAYVDAAPDDPRPAAPDRATQLLDLVLTQSPVGRRLRPALVEVWARAAVAAGVRVPHASLVPLLGAATSANELRATVLPVLGERGHWLAGQRHEWAWAARATTAPDAPAGDDVDPEEWARATTPERVEALAALRRRDPAAARALLESTWSTDAAAARADLLATFVHGLSDADEPVLESALDDRSSKVRDVARGHLDRLPASARARRLGDLLRPLVGSVDGRVSVALPEEPDAAAVRDGLGPAPKGRSQRVWWLGVLARGAPLDVWTEASGLDVASVVNTLDEPTVSLELRTATRVRRDVTWARAHHAHGWEPQLLGLLPADERRAAVLSRIEVCATLSETLGVLDLLPGPWSAPDSERALGRIAQLPAQFHDPGGLAHLLATRLHPDLAPELDRLARRDTPLRDAFHRASQFISLVPTIQEAFR